MKNARCRVYFGRLIFIPHFLSLASTFYSLYFFIIPFLSCLYFAFLRSLVILVLFRLCCLHLLFRLNQNWNQNTNKINYSVTNFVIIVYFFWFQFCIFLLLALMMTSSIYFDENQFIFMVLPARFQLKTILSIMR